MARPTNKTELLAAAREEFELLNETVLSLPETDREMPGACEEWSVKDLLALKVPNIHPSCDCSGLSGNR